MYAMGLAATRSTGATVFEMQLDDFKNFVALYFGTGSPLIQKKQTVDKDSVISGVALGSKTGSRDTLL
ncbi:unnamed protein product [Acanthoscelides obtectus]|uniref:Uncharacterized protein n=1 Tax=Acanthoscelides obtectus TaxID=200917 RepID=A0A9P0M8E9_ACAOB|nr:unnamed protein product [Acanthoscelides obtectus]CAK1642100.1 hypothetical protein AOBTE_LOCUS12833 [Acanthoscelides obtectus]